MLDDGIAPHPKLVNGEDPIFERRIFVGLGIAVPFIAGLVYDGKAFATGMPVCVWPNKDICDVKGDF
jgi:hypothetical protein